MAAEQAVAWHEWVRTSVAALSPVLVVVGWFFVNRQNNQRESRKELRQLVDRTLKAVEETVVLATRYQAGELSGVCVQNMTAWKLILSLNVISGYISTLGSGGLEIVSCRLAFINLKHVLTGDDFMTEAWKPWVKDDPRWNALIASAGQLTRELDRQYFEYVAG